MKKILFFLFALLFCGVNAFSQADKIMGVWLTQESNSQVVITKMSDGKYYGQIKWLKEPLENGKAKLDKNNPETKYRNRPLLNLLLLNSFTYNSSDKIWENGTIYDPKSGKTYKCKIWFDGNDDKTLHVKGFIGISIVGKEVKWARENKVR